MRPNLYMRQMKEEPVLGARQEQASIVGGPAQTRDLD